MPWISRIFFYRSRQFHIILCYIIKFFFLFFACSLLNNNLSNYISIFYTCPLLNFNITFCYSLKARSLLEYIMIENKRGFISVALMLNNRRVGESRDMIYVKLFLKKKKKLYVRGCEKSWLDAFQRPPQDFSTRVTFHTKVESFPRDCESRKFARWITRR